jgi:hypothetical protein
VGALARAERALTAELRRLLSDIEVSVMVQATTDAG